MLYEVTSIGLGISHSLHMHAMGTCPPKIRLKWVRNALYAVIRRILNKQASAKDEERGEDKLNVYILEKYFRHPCT